MFVTSLLVRHIIVFKAVRKPIFGNRKILYRHIVEYNIIHIVL